MVQLTETCRSLSKNFETLNGRKKSALVVAKAQSHSRRNKDVTQLPLTVKELQHAATFAIKATQATTFKDEIKLPSRAKVKDFQGRSTPRNATSLQKLNLFLDQDGIVRVGVQIW